MRKFWKDYAELCKAAGRFYKKHWLGVVLINVVSSAAIMAYYGRDYIKEALEEKFHKDKESY